MACARFGFEHLERGADVTSPVGGAGDQGPKPVDVTGSGGAAGALSPIEGRAGASALGGGGGSAASEELDADAASSDGEPSVPDLGEPASCSDALARGVDVDGVYAIDVDGAGPIEAIDVYCDMTFDGGGWTLIQAYTGAESPDQFPTDDGLVVFLAGPPRPQSFGALGRLVLDPLVANVTQVHMRSSFLGAPENADAASGYWVSSRQPDAAEVTLPVANLRAGRLLNDSSEDSVADWIGPRAPNLTWSPSALCTFSASGYPNIYWACNNAAGLHLITDRARWVYQAAADDPIEVYVR
jgi:hypothetical protein